MVCASTTTFTRRRRIRRSLLALAAFGALGLQGFATPPSAVAKASAVANRSAVYQDREPLEMRPGLIDERRDRQHERVLAGFGRARQGQLATQPE